MARLAGKHALMEILRGEGVKYVFGIPGATEIHFMDGVEQAKDIQYILALHEVVCAGMAEGYARASDQPGFLNLHTAPGLAAATPLLYNAKLGCVPLVITAGQNHTRLLQYDPHLSGDVVGIGRPHVKWATELVHPEDIPAVMQRAFKMAKQPPCGPVLVSIPQDVLEREFDFTYRPGTPVYARLRPDREAVERAAELIARAKKPILVVESGVARSGALDEVVRLAELIGAPVYQNWMADVNFPVNHPQYLGDLDVNVPAVAEVLAGVDVLIGVGCSLFAHGFFNPKMPSLAGVKIVHIDDDPWEIGKNLPTDCGVQGDIKVTLAELCTALEATLDPQAREAAKERAVDAAKQKAAMLAALGDRQLQERNQIPIAPSRLMTEIAAVADENTVVVDECWSSSGLLRQILAPSRPKSYFRSRKGGSIGWGLPGAMGIKLGMPEKRVIAVLGDGSAAWSIQGLWTAARYQIPVTFVILNNATYGQVKLVRKLVLGDYPLEEKHEGMELDRPVLDFSLLARSMGVESERVTEPDEIRPALEQALAANEPRLVEVLVRKP
ncbi:MAG: thiamine pyrophosphate-binding protein [Thermoleophilia bacterium]|nr:thiamine pyrophosphate-binding protein [Thermoleophilia bacterium]